MAHEAIVERVTDVFTDDDVSYNVPGGVGLPVVESSVDAPVVDGNEVGVAVDDVPVEGGVSKVGYGVASAVIVESSVTRYTIKSSVNVAD